MLPIPLKSAGLAQSPSSLPIGVRLVMEIPWESGCQDTSWQTVNSASAATGVLNLIRLALNIEK